MYEHSLIKCDTYMCANRKFSNCQNYYPFNYSALCVAGHVRMAYKNTVLLLTDHPMPRWLICLPTALYFSSRRPCHVAFVVMAVHTLIFFYFTVHTIWRWLSYHGCPRYSITGTTNHFRRDSPPCHEAKLSNIASIIAPCLYSHATFCRNDIDNTSNSSLTLVYSRYT